MACLSAPFVSNAGAWFQRDGLVFENTLWPKLREGGYPGGGGIKEKRAMEREVESGGEGARGTKNAQISGPGSPERFAKGKSLGRAETCGACVSLKTTLSPQCPSAPVLADSLVCRRHWPVHEDERSLRKAWRIHCGRPCSRRRAARPPSRAACPVRGRPFRGERLMRLNGSDARRSENK